MYSIKNNTVCFETENTKCTKQITHELIKSAKAFHPENNSEKFPRMFFGKVITPSYYINNDLITPETIMSFATFVSKLESFLPWKFMKITEKYLIINRLETQIALKLNKNVMFSNLPETFTNQRDIKIVLDCDVIANNNITIKTKNSAVQLSHQELEDIYKDFFIKSLENLFEQYESIESKIGYSDKGCEITCLGYKTFIDTKNMSLHYLIDENKSCDHLDFAFTKYNNHVFIHNKRGSENCFCYRFYIGELYDL